MLLLTVATERLQAVKDWEQLAKTHGYKSKILGEGVTWDGWGTYQRLLRDFLFSYEGCADEIIAKVDSYDLLVTAPSPELEAKYLAYNKPVVVGGEASCGPNSFRHTQTVNSSKYKWVNAGMVMGTVKALREMYSWCFSNFPADDQVAIGMYFEKFPDRLEVDGKQSIVANLHSLNEITWDGRRYRHTETGEYPIFLHTPAISMDLGRRNESIRKQLVEGYIPLPKYYYAIDYAEHVTKEARTNPVYTFSVATGTVIVAILLMLLAAMIVWLALIFR